MRAEYLCEAIPFCTRLIEYGEFEKEILEKAIRSIPNRKIALLTRSVLDKGTVTSWNDALNDRVNLNGEEVNMFELIRDCSTNIRPALEFLREMEGTTKYPCHVLKYLLGEDWPDPIDHPEYCLELPRLLVTPTRQIVSGFDIEISNRVVREFIRQGYTPEDFLRVTFCEENAEPLFNDDFKSTQISERIKSLLLNGIKLNGHEYKFLAYSSSQLKESSVWMVDCSGRPDLIKKIRTWMGDFSDIKIPSKYASRMGQCFSTTIDTKCGTDRNVPLDHSSEHLNPLTFLDYYAYSPEGFKLSCLSDGAGLIRKDTMKKVMQNIPSVTNPDSISIIQIRYGGAKGTLTAWESKNKLFNLYLRPSMVKFPAPYKNLEVIKVGKFVPYYLNRQMILLLGVHKVTPSIFLKLQSSMLDDLDAMLRDKVSAYEKLSRLSGLQSDIQSQLLHMLECGFCPSTDPFLFSCLHALRAHHLINLKKKSRIHVSKGAVLMGSIDVNGKVDEGCIFVQLETRDKIQHTPLIGPVLVAKHPVTHPGDVRMLLAVDIPQLRNKKNVILFSIHGFRSEASKMSGSDLDGDEFAVTWDKRLFLNDWNDCKFIDGETFQSKSGRLLKASASNHSDVESANYPPMEFDTQGEAEQVKNVTNEHLIDHFVQFGAADTLGKIAMLWLDHASNEKKADCKQCLELAKLHSIAVDYPKSGVPAVIPRDLLIPLSAPRPHWREKKNCETYHCESSLGQLYDNIIQRAENEDFKCNASTAGRIFNKKGQLLCFTHKNHTLDKSTYRPEIAEILSLFPLKKGCKGSEFISFAFEQRYSYEDTLLTLMNKYKIHSEGEVLTGCILKFHKLNKKRQYELAQEVRRQSGNLMNSFRKLFLKKILSLVVSLESICESDMDHYLSWANVVASTSLNELNQKLSFVKEKASEDGIYIDKNENEISHFRYLAWKMAAAYYFVTFQTTEHDGNSHEETKIIENHALYSFPHIIYDILSVGLREVENLN